MLFKLVQTQIKLIIDLNLSNDLNALLIILSILEKRCRCKPSNRFAIVRSRHRTHHPSCWLSFACSYSFVYSVVFQMLKAVAIYDFDLLWRASYIGTRFVVACVGYYYFQSCSECWKHWTITVTITDHCFYFSLTITNSKNQRFPVLFTVLSRRHITFWSILLYKHTKLFELLRQNSMK